MIKKTIKNTTSDRKYGQIMGINVISTDISSVITRLRDLISHNKKFYIVTPNPELVIMAQKSYELKTALNAATIAIPDGIGIIQASKYLSLPAPTNKFLRVFVTLYQGLLVGFATIFNKKWLTSEMKPIKGRLMFLKLIELANKKGWRVFFLGGENGEAQKAAEKLRINYKSVKIESFEGPQINNFGSPASDFDKKLQKDVIDKINKFKPHLLFVAFGNPKQEIWIYNNIKALDIGGAMAIGGTLRYISELSKLPPMWMEKTGLEWLWRLVTEPTRIKRIWNAAIVFPLKIFLSKINS